MGRKKIAIRPLTEDRNRNVTFLKRKAGLMKKAWELSVLCHADISMIIFSQQGKLFEFSSKNLDESLRRYHDYAGPVERKCGADYAKTNGGDGDDDEDRSSSDGEGAGAGASGSAPAQEPPQAGPSGTTPVDVKPNNGGAKKTGGSGQSVHSNLRGKEEWKEASHGGYLGARGGGSGWAPTAGSSGGGNKRMREDDGLSSRRHPRISSPDAKDRGFDGRHRASHSDRSDEEDPLARGRNGRPPYITIPSARYSPPPQPALNSLYGSGYRSHSSSELMTMRTDDPARSESSQLPVMGPYSSYSGAPEDWSDPNNTAVEQLHAQMRSEQAALEELRRRAAQNAEWQRRIEETEMASPMGINLGQGANLQSFNSAPMQTDAEMRAMLAEIMAAEQGNAQSHAAYQAHLHGQPAVNYGDWQTSQLDGMPLQQQSVGDLLDIMRSGNTAARRPGLSRSQSIKEEGAGERGGGMYGNGAGLA